jgi:hypothetical protein
VLVAILILEDGTGLSNSNSYVDLAYADAYFSNHPFYADAWANITDEDIRTALLISASGFLDAHFDFTGYRATTTQAMDWPRVYAQDKDGFVIPNYTIPGNLKKATCEQAFVLSKGDPGAPLPGVGLTELKIDVIDLKFDKAVRTPLVNGNVIALLRGMAEFVFARRIRKVVVG